MEHVQRRLPAKVSSGHVPGLAALCGRTSRSSARIGGASRALFAWVAIVPAIVGVTTVGWSEPPRDGGGGEIGKRAAPSNSDTSEAIEHGGYLVMNVAMCVQCHSPHREDGSLIEERLLQGAPIPVESPFRQSWAFAAPKIAGLPGGWTKEALATLLMTGRRPDGTLPQPPMPPFRMNAEDAAAVAEYLASLK